MMGLRQQTVGERRNTNTGEPVASISILIANSGTCDVNDVYTCVHIHACSTRTQVAAATAVQQYYCQYYPRVE